MPRRKSIPSKNKPSERPLHPWRLCPYGEHWVGTHPFDPRGKGKLTTRRGHCAKNPSGKDKFYPEEIHLIAEQYFAGVTNKPCPTSTTFGKIEGAYDHFIGGWVQYWNEVLKSDIPLEPNMVKALIATESSFNTLALANKKKPKSARGLTQITNKTRKILGDEKGELKDHFIEMSVKDLNDPNINICAGVRWLFHKRNLISSKLKRPATWMETIYDYKGLSLAKTEKRRQDIINAVKKFYEAYQKCGK